MKQQVNLYQPIFRKQKKVFSAVAMLQVCLIVLALFILTAGYSYRQLQRLQRQETAAQASLENLQGQIAELKARSSDDAAKKLLESEIGRITREVEQKQRVAAMLEQGAFTNTLGFVRHFEALARQHVAGTWLTEINISNGGSSLSLDGITFSAELVPVYLQRLLQEEVFTGISFNVLGMERSAAKPEELNFQVGTSAEGKPDDNS
jgi:competence protein ComGC